MHVHVCAPRHIARVAMCMHASAAESARTLTGEKENQRGKSEKPTGASEGSSCGKSCIMHACTRGASVRSRAQGARAQVHALARACIMHSRRVGDLKVVLLASLYLGLTNSGITPPLASSTDAYLP